MAALAGAAVLAVSPAYANPPKQGSTLTQSEGVPADWNTLADRFGGSKAETRAAQDVVMKFTFPTEIREISVVGGQRVRKGEVLIRARDADLIAAIEQQKMLAESDLEVRAAESALELARIRHENLKTFGEFSAEEFDTRRIEADQALIQRDQAKVNLEQQKLRLKQLEGQYERYRLEAPFDGIVEDVTVELGQGVSENDPAIRIVDIDKLELEPTPSIDETLRLGISGGSRCWVLIDLPDRPLLVEGRVQYVSPVGESVGLTRRVQVEIDNPEGLPAGTQARVRFTEPEGEWMRYLRAPGDATASLPPRAEEERGR